MIMAKQDQNKLLNEVESKDWLKKAGIPVNPTFLARSLQEAVSLSRNIGFPVAMKIVSNEIAHKSDVGGVKLGLRNSSQIRKAYQEMMISIKSQRPDARIEGASIQKMARPGVELIIGMSQDSQFGPVIMFGLGGIMVEVLKDISFRLVPVTTRDASEMIREIKGLALLQGYRGQEAVDLALLEKLIVDVSKFVENNPQIQELDLNPVYGYKDGTLAVDARIVTQ
jgi:acyl-CoA synthetase (NDP forming)